jgi:hypothetical protein
MIRPLSQITPSGRWGRLTRQFADSGKKGVALPLDVLGPWISQRENRTAVELLYSGLTAAEVDAWGLADRRLLLEREIFRRSMPDNAVSAVLAVPSMLGEGPWILAASPEDDVAAGGAWRAQSSQGLIDALRLIWAEYVSRAMESRVPVGDIGTGVLILADSGYKMTPEDPDPLEVSPELQEAIFGGWSAGPPAGDESMEPAYRFGRVFNRLLCPDDPFSYLCLLHNDAPELLLKEWKAASDAAGYGEDLRRRAADAMETALESAGSVPGGETGGDIIMSIRQVSGFPSSPGAERGFTWRPDFEPSPPAGPRILLFERFHAGLLPHLPGAAGLAECLGGRGGPGALAARLRNIPAICEARHALNIQDGTEGYLDGQNGILTLFHSLPV